MKSIEQLLQLSKNPYYVFTPEEQQVLDDFLSKKKAKSSKTSPSTSDSTSSTNTAVRVRNIVPKTIPGVPDAPEPSQVS